MLVRAAGTGFNPHTAVVNESTETGRLRLITSMANTARCLGAPNGIRAPSAVITNGPKTPNPRPMFLTALQPPGVIDGLSSHFDRKHAKRVATARCVLTAAARPCVLTEESLVAYDRPSCPPTVVSDRSGPRG